MCDSGLRILEFWIGAPIAGSTVHAIALGKMAEATPASRGRDAHATLTQASPLQMTPSAGGTPTPP
jgi:hypothetical protein